MRTYYFKKAYYLLQSNLLSIIYSLIVFCVFVAISEFVVSAERDKVAVQEKIAAAAYANALKTKVDRELNKLLFVSSGLSSYLTVYHDQLDPSKLQAILADLYTQTQHVRNLGVAVGYRLTYVYPPSLNQKAIGIDYRDLPMQWPQVKLAVERHQGVLAGPLDLVQGGSGLIYRYPVYIDNEFWGLLSTVIDADSFFKAAFKNLTDKKYQFSIRLNGTSNVFYGDPQLFKHRKALITVSNFPNTQWEWAILNSSEKTPELLQMIRVMGIVISLLLALMVFYLLKEHEKLAAQAMYDSLTGVANRRLMHFKITQTLAQAKRFNRLMAVMFIDIDYFKKVNDTYGHDFGDELLKVVATRLGSCIRNVDNLSRVGGDEFVIVIDELRQINDVNLIADKIMRRFEAPIMVDHQAVPLTLSIGIAICDLNQTETIKSLMKKADIALYEVKSRGRNGYTLYAASS